MSRANLILCLILIITLSSCYRTTIVAPYKKNVRLAEADDELPYKVTRTQFYWLYGSVSFRKSKPERIIEDNEFVVVRMESKVTIWNSLMNVLFNLVPTTIVTNTVIVEGDTKDKPKKSSWD